MLGGLGDQVIRHCIGLPKTVVKTLLKFGADAWAKDGFGTTPTEWAWRNERKRESEKVVTVLRLWQKVEVR
jgi:hypothetical protein